MARQSLHEERAMGQSLPRGAQGRRIGSATIFLSTAINNLLRNAKGIRQGIRMATAGPLVDPLRGEGVTPTGETGLATTTCRRRENQHSSSRPIRRLTEGAAHQLDAIRSFAGPPFRPEVKLDLQTVA